MAEPSNQFRRRDDATRLSPLNPMAGHQPDVEVDVAARMSGSFTWVATDAEYLGPATPRVVIEPEAPERSAKPDVS